MAFCPLDLTTEQLDNAIRNQEFITSQPKATDTQEDIANRLEQIDNIAEKKDNQYRLGQAPTPIRTTVTTEIKKNRAASIKASLEDLSETPDNILKKEAGTRLHYIREVLMEHYAHNKGSLENIKKEAMTGNVKMTAAHFELLRKDAEELHKTIVAQQKAIDPNGTVKIYTEIKIVDPIQSIGSAIDVLALFSDGSASYYDYKHKTNTKNLIKVGNSYRLVGEVVGFHDLEDYEAQMWEYRRILLNVYGVKKIRQSRILPSFVALKLKEKDQRKTGEILQPEIFLIKTQTNSIEGEASLNPLPIGGEVTGNPKIDELIDKVGLLKSRLDMIIRSGKAGRKYATIREKSARLGKIMREVSLLGGYTNIQKEVRNLVNIIIDEKFEEGASDIDLVHSAGELAVYEELIPHLFDAYAVKLEGTTMSKADKEEATKSFLKTKRSLNDGISTALAKVDRIILSRKAALMQEQGVVEGDNQQKTWTSMFNIFYNTSEIDHPIFKTFVKIKDKALAKRNGNRKVMVDKILQAKSKFSTWAKQNGYSDLDAYDLLINKATGNLVDKYSKDFWKARKEALETKDTEWFLKHHTQRKGAKALYDQMFQSYKEDQEQLKKAEIVLYKENGLSIEDASKKAQAHYEFNLQNFEQRFDVFSDKNLKTALSSAGRGKMFYELNHSALKDYITPEYKRISNTPALKEFYEFIENFNTEMREILGLKYKEIPPTFIANIRKTFIEKVTNGDGNIFTNIGNASQELLASLSVREDDAELFGIRNPETGEIERSIPKYFLNPFKDKNEKSYDLGRVMLLFADMVYNYQAMEEIEGSTLALKEAMILSPSFADLGDGRTKARYLKTKDPLYSLFEAHTDYYVYGVRMRSESKKGASYAKALLQAKQYMTLKTLGLGWLPGLSAFVASKAFTRIEAIKGEAFTSEQYSKAHSILMKDTKLAKALIDTFEATAETPLFAQAQSVTASKAQKLLNSENIMFPYRLGDLAIDHLVLISMLQNYGFDQDGKLRRLKNLPKGTKSIMDSAVLDKKGELMVTGLTSDGIIAVKNAVRHVTRGIKGLMTPEDIAATSTSLGWNLAMQFKNWMPGFINERLKGLQYVEAIDATQMGRYTATFSSQWAKEDAESLGQYLKAVLPDTMIRLAQNIFLGWAPGMSYKTNVQRSKAYYNNWVKQNPEAAKNISYEQFLEAQQNQVRAMSAELRVVLAFATIIFMLAADWDDDGTPLYQDNWMARKLYQLLIKSENELTFLTSPTDFVRFAATNPMPISRLLIDTSKLLNNTFDEAHDAILGIEGTPEDARDKTPWGYYSSSFIPGGIHIRRTFEVFKQDKENPYQD